MELNPPIDSMINNFIKENKYVLIWISNFVINWDITSIIIIYE
jgi:hypothetical protein